MNKHLFIFDLVFFPITIIRLLIIYFNGSRYNINGFEILDIMQHSKNKYFNQQEINISIDIDDEDIRRTIYNSSTNKKIE
jgi:hypothetical protein